MLRNPSNAELADALGLSEAIDPARVFDVVVVGAGPAGLAAAVYAASEGPRHAGDRGRWRRAGRPGTSSRIENYLGFPTGISGQALAGRAQVQAQKFGAQARDLARGGRGRLDCEEQPYCSARSKRAREVRRREPRRRLRRALPQARRRRITNGSKAQGIHYAATAMEATLCGGEEVIVIGGGNSAGQAAVFLAQQTAHVHIVVRAADLAATMSDYLIERIEASPRITLRTQTEIAGLAGDGRLRSVVLANRASGKTRPSTSAIYS